LGTSRTTIAKAPMRASYYSRQNDLNFLHLLMGTEKAN